MTPLSAKSATPENSISGDVHKDGGLEGAGKSPREIVLARRLVASYRLENGGADVHFFTSDETTVVRNGILVVAERDGLPLVAAVVYPMQDGFHAIRYDPDVSLEILKDVEADNPGQVIYSPRHPNGDSKEYVGTPDIARAVEPADRPLAKYEMEHIGWLMHIVMQMTVLNGGSATGPTLMNSAMLRRLLK